MRPGRLAVLALVLCLGGRTAPAAECPGPAECCVDKVADELTETVRVSVGVVMVGIYNVNEKSGTWDGAYYLYEAWTPRAGFVPQTEVVNEVDRLHEANAGLWKQGDRCVRYTRIRSTLSSPLNLRLFPFDARLIRVLHAEDTPRAGQRAAQRRFVIEIALDDLDAVTRQCRRLLALRLARQAAQTEPAAPQRLRDRAALMACHSGDENRSIVRHG